MRDGDPATDGNRGLPDGDARRGGLRIGPWLPQPRTSARRGRHAAEPVDALVEPATRLLPAVTVPREPPGPRIGRVRWLVIAVIAVGLAVAVSVPLLAGHGPNRPASPGGTAGAVIPAAPVPVPSDPSVPDSPSASPSASAAPSPSPSRAASPTRVGPPVPAPAPIAIEAEDPRNELGGSAWIDQYPGASGGRIVRNIGLWNGSSHHAGWLRFTGVDPGTAGTYLLTFYAVHLDAQPDRTVEVSISDGPAITVPVTASDACCTAVRVRVALRATGNTITFSNPDDHGPSIDRITVTAA